MSYTENTRPTLVCQYWREDEPVQCKYWDTETTTCTYEEVTTIADTSVVVRGDLYPLCNYIGTASNRCTKYSASTVTDDDGNTVTTSSRCVLPDPYRIISMSPNCGKWVTPVTTSSGTDPLDYSKINGYNDGACNSEGTQATTCSGFNAGHLGIGAKPIPEKCTITGTVDVIWTEKLPIMYDVMNKRSQLGRCKWWGSTDYEFTLGGDHTKGETYIVAPDWSCTNSDSDVKSNFSTFYSDTTNNYFRPPCNGAMPDCPKYTGNLVSTGFLPYISNVFMRNGDKVLAEQILELRYNMRKERWTSDSYESYFDDPVIFANTGITPSIVQDSNSGSVLDYEIVSQRIEIDDFDCFSIARTQVTLTKGTTTENNKTNFDTLIQEMKDLELGPIIRSTFDELVTSTTSDKHYVFETPYSEQKEILIVGDHFSDDATIVAVNISDEDIAFPWPEMFEYGNIYDYAKSMSDTMFAKVKSYLACYFTLLGELSPDKMYSNELSSDCRAFSIGVETLFGDNKIMVFDLSDDAYAFDTIHIKKVFVGGVIAQTGFKVYTSDTTNSGTYDYELKTCYSKFNPTLTYKFNSLRSSDNSYAVASHTYLDTKVTALQSPTSTSENDTITVGYRMYKVQVLDTFSISTCESTSDNQVKLLGNSGYMLVIIDDDKQLHSVIRKWDSGETDEDGNSEDFTLTWTGVDADGEEQSIEMEVVEYATARMENNQMLLKPKDDDSYVRLYGGEIAFDTGLYVYDRYSFGETPDGTYEEINDDWSDDDTLIFADDCKLTSSSSTYTISTPPTAPLTAAVVFKGSLTGRIKGQAKSELIVWVKQPFCSDVEIKYSWTANYKQYTLTPYSYCFVSSIGTVYEGTTTKYYSPMCGDHYFGSYSTRPATMWYPYTACDAYASYNINTKTEYDVAPMEFWLDENNNYDADATDHGANDLRMLGPWGSYGVTTDYHAHLWACGCDYTHMNSYKLSSSWFSGNANIRSGVDAEDLYYMTRNGGTGPKFGNKHRGYLFSFRSVAALDYYETDDDGDITVAKKWMPAYESFSDLGFNSDFTNYPWELHFNTGDNICTYLNQFGLSLLSGEADGIDIDEALVYDEDGDLARYSFTDVFKSHTATVELAYPKPRVQYYTGTSLTPISAWLTYKDFTTPDGTTDTTKAIQWAWREKWKDIERTTFDLTTALSDVLDSYLEAVAAGDTDATYDTSSYFMTYLSFINLFYPNYTYDVKITELRRAPEEGDHALVWEVSTFVEDDYVPQYFILSLDGGPYRLYDPTCTLVTDFSTVPEDIAFDSVTLDDLEKHMNFYDICSGDSWLNSVTCDADLEDVDSDSDSSIMLYDSTTDVTDSEDAAIENATDDDREVYTRDDTGEAVYYYFNRGLVYELDDDMLKYLPRQSVEIDPDTLPYQFSLSLASDDDTDYSTVEPGTFYPAEVSFGMTYEGLSSSGDLSLIFKFDTPMVISKAKLVFNYGLEESTKAGTGTQLDVVTRNYYNIPEMVISKSDDNNSYTTLYSSDLVIGEDDITYDVVTADLYELSDMDSPYTYIKFYFNYMLSEDDISDIKDDFTEEATLLMHYYMNLVSVTLYRTEYLSLTESITTYERKFNISYGSYGTYPTHGFESTGSLLYTDSSSLSTIYQMDTSTGMLGMSDSDGEFTTGSKLRNRICFECRDDPEALTGTYSDFEAKQKELYDEVSLAGDETITFTSVAAEVLAETLQDTNVNTYPSWSTKLVNKNMVALAEVEAKDKYYPEGFYWTWDTDSVTDFYNCGDGGKHKTRKIFDYAFSRVSGVYGNSYDPDIIDVYVYSTLSALASILSN